MANFSRKLDVQQLLSYADDFVEVLHKKKDINDLMQSLEGAKQLQSSCEADFSKVQNQLQDYQKKITACKQKIDESKTEVIDDAELDHLQNELDQELQKEQALREELRAASNEIDDLEYKRISVEEQKRVLKKVERDELRQQKKLSMYASVTNIIPDLGDQTTISGQIVDKNKKLVEKFEFKPTETSPAEICNCLWRMMDL